jgi:hypothetical protein
MNILLRFISLAVAIRPITASAITAANEVGVDKTGFTRSGTAWQITSEVAISALASMRTPLLRLFMRRIAGKRITPMSNAAQIKASAQHRKAMQRSEAPHGPEPKHGASPATGMRPVRTAKTLKRR